MVYLDDSDGTEERIAAHFLERPGVARKKAFGRDAITINEKIFMIFRLGELVVKLPAEDGLKLIEAGEAEQFEPAPGRYMKEWFLFGPELDEDRWVEIAESSFDYVVALTESATSDR